MEGKSKWEVRGGKSWVRRPQRNGGWRYWPRCHILIESEEGFRAEGEIEGGIQDLL